MLTNNQQYLGDAKVVITSYSMMEKHLSNLKALNFGVIIFDESHSLKNKKAKCTIVADALSLHAKRILMLSGTPALSRPEELYKQLQMIDRKFLSYMEYSKFPNFCCSII